MEELIRAEAVTKVYNPGRPDEFRALDGISLGLAEGDIVVFKGPSGSGKTTLLSLVGCMARPTAGRVLVGGRDVAKLPERFLTRIRRQTFGFIFQQFHLLRDLTVLENVLLPLYPLGLGLHEMRSRGEAILGRLGLAGKSSMRIRQLSGGEQQRAAIARALVNEPRILIADEPTAHLDSRLAADFLDILVELNRQGKTVLVATHDPAVFGHPAASRVVEMRDGRITGIERR